MEKTGKDGAKKRRVLIVGGGFGGLNAAKALANRAEVDVTLVDQRNYHLFQPLLYQVATAGLNPADIAVPIRSLFPKDLNVAVQLARVTGIDLAGKFATVRDADDKTDQRIDWDYLILAAGSLHSYFGKSEWEEFAPGLKTVEQATEIRRRILSAFELAETETDPARERALLNFVIVGGGATGVELAGAIADIARTVLYRDFRRINPASARVILIEAGPRLLGAFPEDLARRAARDLEQLGVEVRVGTRVEKIDAEGVNIPGERIPAHSVFWGAGVQGAGIGKKLGVPVDRAGRVIVAPDLSIPSQPDAFVVGDLAHLDLGEGKQLPGLAPAAIQTGRWAARNILASIRGEERRPFKYKDKGIMATIGKHKAVAMAGKLKLTGYLAWLAWLFVHVLYLIGFRNRVAVMFEWSWSYLFSKRGSRLITSRTWELEAPKPVVASNAVDGKTQPPSTAEAATVQAARAVRASP